jgi:hypothetical protein
MAYHNPYQDPHRNRSVTQNLEYWDLHNNRHNLAWKIKTHLDWDYNTRRWAPYTVTARVNPEDHESAPYDIFININSRGRRYAHISFHAGPSGSAIGSTHIRYDGRGGPARRIIIDNGRFELDYQEEPNLEHVAFEGRILIALNEFNDETPIISDYPTPTNTDTYNYTYNEGDEHNDEGDEHNDEGDEHNDEDDPNYKKYLKYKNKYLQLKYKLGI